MGRLDDVLNANQVKKLKRWCLLKQASGFQGRPNKDPDTCYSFWIGATLKLLGAYRFVNTVENVEFVLATEDNVLGGLAKYPESFPGERNLLAFYSSRAKVLYRRFFAHVSGDKRPRAHL